MRTTTRRAIAATAAVALLLVGCDGDTADSGPSTASGPRTAVADSHGPSSRSGAVASDEAAVDDLAAPEAAIDIDGGDDGVSDDITTVVFDDHGVAQWVDAADQATSTFRTDATVASYRMAQSWLSMGVLPPAEAVRAEEWVNALDHDYPAPSGNDTWAFHADAAAPLWQPGENAPQSTRLMRLGLRATDGIGQRPPASVTFVIDVSGSMSHDNRLDTVVDVIDGFLDRLEPRDQVAIVTFHTNANLELAHTSDFGQVRDVLAGLVPLNSTNTGAGTVLGFETAAAGHRNGDNSTVVVIADGMANEGTTDPADIAAQLDEIDTPARLVTHTVGIGREVYNDALLAGLASETGGTYAYIDRSDQADQLFNRDLPLLWPVAHDVKTQVEFNPAAVRSWRLLGYESRTLAEDDFRDDDVSGAYVGAGHAVTALYEVDLAVEGDSTATLGTATVRWADPDSGDINEMEADLPASLATTDSTSPSFGRAAAMAALVEALRGSPHALINFEQVADSADGDLADLVKAARDAFRGAPDRVEFVQP